MIYATHIYIILYKYRSDLCIVLFTTNSITLLEKTHAMTIPIVLMDGGSMKKTVLYQHIARNTKAIADRLHELEEVSLLTITKSEEHPFPQIVELTPRGHRVAEHLAAIEEILQRREKWVKEE
jgi:DNA-binding HxlR family transcriptional regulator